MLWTGTLVNAANLWRRLSVHSLLCLHILLKLSLLAFVFLQCKVTSQRSKHTLHTWAMNKSPNPVFNQMMSSPMLRLTFPLLSLLTEQSSSRKELILGEDCNYRTTRLVVGRTLSLHASTPVPQHSSTLSISGLFSAWYCWLMHRAGLAHIFSSICGMHGLIPAHKLARLWEGVGGWVGRSLRDKSQWDHLFVLAARWSLLEPTRQHVCAPPCGFLLCFWNESTVDLSTKVHLKNTDMLFSVCSVSWHSS